MKNLVSISELAVRTGLSIKTIRRRVYNGTLPFIRANPTSRYSKLLFNVELVQQVLLNEAISSMCSTDRFTESKDSLIAFDNSFDLDDEEQPTNMANIHKQFGKITQGDVDAGRFAPDTFAFKPSGEPTSETLRAEKAPKKP